MDDNTPSKSGPETATGGCALGFGLLFLVAEIAILLLLWFTRGYKPATLMVSLFIGGPSFFVGHHLAIVAIQSKSEAARQSGKRALVVMWSGVAVFLLIYLVLLPLPHLSVR